MNESDIDRLLREQSPEIPIRPGLETRIRASLRQAETSRRSRAWLAVPVAAAAIILAIAVAPREPGETLVVNPPDPAPEVVPPEVDEALPVNTLGHEARAIRNDAERTGRFLLNCLPSVTKATP